MSTPVIERTTIHTPALDMESDWYRQEDLVPYEDTNDPNKKAHIVNPPMNLHIWRPGMEAQDVVDIARIQGLEIVALCQYKWVPKHNPDKLDVCGACMNIAQQMMAEDGE